VGDAHERLRRSPVFLQFAHSRVNLETSSSHDDEYDGSHDGRFYDGRLPRRSNGRLSAARQARIFVCLAFIFKAVRASVCSSQHSSVCTASNYTGLSPSHHRSSLSRQHSSSPPAPNEKVKLGLEEQCRLWEEQCRLYPNYTLYPNFPEPLDRHGFLFVLRLFLMLARASVCSSQHRCHSLLRAP